MILDTTVLGQIKYEEDEIITFIQGIPGFDHLHKYLIVESKEHEAIAYLQSIEEERLHFAMINPFYVYKQYDFEIDETDQAELGIESQYNVEVWSIITMHEDVQETSINLLAPVIINKNNKKAKQIILHSSGYRTKHRLYDLMAEASK